VKVKNHQLCKNETEWCARCQLRYCPSCYTKGCPRVTCVAREPQPAEPTNPTKPKGAG
jgi:hypothetical protein